MRIYHDRLVSTEDKNLFIEAAVEYAREIEQENVPVEAPVEKKEEGEGEKKE